MNSVQGTGAGYRFPVVRGRNSNNSIAAAAVISSRFPPGQRHASPSRRSPWRRGRHLLLDRKSLAAVNLPEINTHASKVEPKHNHPQQKLSNYSCFSQVKHES